MNTIHIVEGPRVPAVNLKGKLAVLTRPEGTALAAAL